MKTPADVKMRSDVKQKWVAALRSGEYQQGTGALRANDTYCCLGVLCDVAIKEGLDVKIVSKIDWSFDEVPTEIVAGVEIVSFCEGDTFAYDGHADWEVLPKSVADWAGLEESNPTIKDELTGTSDLAGINDSGRDFNYIADIIERNL